MEDGRPPVNENESRMSKSADKKKRDLKTSFQAKLLELKDKSSDNKSQSETTPESKHKLNRLQKLLGRIRLFGGNVVSTESLPLEAPLSESSSESKIENSYLDSLPEEPKDSYLSHGEKASTPEPKEKLIESISSPDRPVWTFKTEGETKIIHDQPTEIEQSIDHSAEETISELKVSQETKSEPSETPSSPLTKEAQPKPITPEPTEIISERLHYENLAQQLARQERLVEPAYEEQIKPTRESIEGKMDYQTYKIKREIRKRAKKLERVIRKTEPERQVPEPEHIIIKSERVERVEIASDVKLPEQHVERTEKTEVTPSLPSQEATSEISRQTISSPEVILSPKGAFRIEKVLERVVEAAENNEPIEKFLEQRHEIKDTSHAASPVPIGSVVNEALKRYAEQSAPPQLASAESLHRTLAKQQEALGGQTNSMYTSAMRWGFWSAATIIVLTIIAYLVTR